MDDTQLNWLQAHGSEHAEILAASLDHGFKLCYLDGDRRNDSPENLVLIWGKDAGKLENLAPMKINTIETASFMEERLNKSRACYELRRGTSETWEEIAGKVGVHPSNAVTLAKGYATTRNLPWPIK